MTNDYVWREYVEDVSHIRLYTGWALRRHVLAIHIQRFGCWVRGWHTWAWEPDWRDWYCSHCYTMDATKDATEVMAFVASKRA